MDLVNINSSSSSSQEEQDEVVAEATSDSPASPSQHAQVLTQEDPTFFSDDGNFQNLQILNTSSENIFCDCDIAIIESYPPDGSLCSDPSLRLPEEKPFDIGEIFVKNHEYQNRKDIHFVTYEIYLGWVECFRKLKFLIVTKQIEQRMFALVVKNIKSAEMKVEYVKDIINHEFNGMGLTFIFFDY